MKYIRNTPEYKHRRQELRYNQTDAERLLWRYLRNRRFLGLKFFRQYGAGQYILDFYCPARRLAIELDGGQHNGCEEQEYDLTRTAYLKRQGIDVIRFWNHDVLRDTQCVLSVIEMRVTQYPPS